MVPEIRREHYYTIKPLTHQGHNFNVSSSQNRVSKYMMQKLIEQEKETDPTIIVGNTSIPLWGFNNKLVR